jgi:hypothetical protein
MPAGQMSLSQMPVDQMPFDEMYVGSNVCWTNALYEM